VAAVVSVEQLWRGVRFWRAAAAVLATAALALMVAALVSREPADFAARPVIAALRERGQHLLWNIRLARAAHQIAIDAFDPPAPPVGAAYQLWLAAPGTGPPRPLGLLPGSGRKIIAETPANIRLLAGNGELEVTLEPATGTLAETPSGPPLFHASFPGSL
jgi:anti-sigma-K factor RskA